MVTLPFRSPDRERRASARGPLLMLVHATDGSELWAFDIGLGGLKCTTHRPRWPGSYLDLRFELPDTREAVRAGGQVTSLDTSTHGELVLGVRFCRLADGERLRIYRFLDRRRSLWAPDSDIPPAASARSGLGSHPAMTRLLGRERPYAGLLAEAYAALAAAA